MPQPLPEEESDTPVLDISGIISLVVKDSLGQLTESSGQGVDALAEIVDPFLELSARVGQALSLEELQEVDIFGKSLCTVLLQSSDARLGAVLKQSANLSQVVGTLKRQISHV